MPEWPSLSPLGKSRAQALQPEQEALLLSAATYKPSLVA